MAEPNIFSKDPQERDLARRISRYNSKDHRVKSSITLFMDNRKRDLILGDSSELMELIEVKSTLRLLFNATRPMIEKPSAIPGILLSTYGIKVLSVYSGYVQPIGFDFTCSNVDRLINDMKSFSKDPTLVDPNDRYSIPRKPVFNIDSPSNPLGRFASMVTEGIGFRQISLGASLHVELNSKRGSKCNIHLDKAGIVCGFGTYNLLNFINHGLIDLLPGYVNSPFLLGSHGSLTWRPDPVLYKGNDPFGFGTGSDFHDQSMVNNNPSGWYIGYGYKGTFDKF